MQRAYGQKGNKLSLQEEDGPKGPGLDISELVDNDEEILSGKYGEDFVAVFQTILSQDETQSGVEQEHNCLLSIFTDMQQVTKAFLGCVQVDESIRISGSSAVVNQFDHVRGATFVVMTQLKPEGHKSRIQIETWQAIEWNNEELVEGLRIAKTSGMIHEE